MNGSPEKTTFENSHRPMKKTTNDFRNDMNSTIDFKRKDAAKDTTNPLQRNQYQPTNTQTSILHVNNI